MRLCFLLAVLASSTAAQGNLRQQIQRIALEAHGQVSVACSLPGSALNCDLNPNAHPPMQSVFKLPLVMTVLHQVEAGKFSMDQLIRFRPEDLILPKPHSPLQDKYPNAGVDVPLRTLLQLTVSQSDNTAADMLLRLAGGPSAVDDYVASLGVAGFHLQDGEHELHRSHALQYRNWFAPRGAVQLLRRINDKSPLTVQDTELLLGWMLVPRNKRLAGDLPNEVKVAHKSGTSDIDNGIAAATNDIGLIALPDGRELALAVFVTDSKADDANRDKVVARIARAAYNAASGKNPNNVFLSKP